VNRSEWQSLKLMVVLAMSKGTQQAQIEMVREMLLAPGQTPCIPQAVPGAFDRQLECSSAHGMRGEKEDPGSARRLRALHRPACPTRPCARCPSLDSSRTFPLSAHTAILEAQRP
jgi:hypothetical protein